MLGFGFRLTQLTDLIGASVAEWGGGQLNKLKFRLPIGHCRLGEAFVALSEFGSGFKLGGFGLLRGGSRHRLDLVFVAALATVARSNEQ